MHETCQVIEVVSIAFVLALGLASFYGVAMEHWRDYKISRAQRLQRRLRGDQDARDRHARFVENHVRFVENLRKMRVNSGPYRTQSQRPAYELCSCGRPLVDHNTGEYRMLDLDEVKRVVDAAQVLVTYGPHAETLRRAREVLGK